MTVPRVVAIAQARLGSDRLPGKVLQDLGGRSLVQRLADVLHAARRLDGIVFAIPERDADLAEHLQDVADVQVHLGPEHDVLARYVGAGEAAGADVVVRVTGDCPLLDPQLVDEAVAAFLRSEADYLTVEGHARGLGDVEVASLDALRLADRRAPADSPHREHVMTWLATHDDEVDVVEVQAQGGAHRPDLRVCVDTPEDLAVVRAVWDVLLPTRPPTEAEVIAVLDAHPEVRALNQAVVQKPPPPR